MELNNKFKFMYNNFKTTLWDTDDLNVKIQYPRNLNT